MVNRILILGVAAALVFAFGCDSQKQESKKPAEEEKSAEAVENVAGEPYEIIEEEPEKTPTLETHHPVAYGTISSDEFALLAFQTHSRVAAEEESKRLRRERINNYIFADENENYFVLIGNFPSERQALRAVKRLQKYGLGTFRLFTLDSAKAFSADTSVTAEQVIPPRELP